MLEENKAGQHTREGKHVDQGRPKATSDPLQTPKAPSRSSIHACSRIVTTHFSHLWRGAPRNCATLSAKCRPFGVIETPQVPARANSGHPTPTGGLGGERSCVCAFRNLQQNQRPPETCQLGRTLGGERGRDYFKSPIGILKTS